MLSRAKNHFKFKIYVNTCMYVTVSVTFKVIVRILLLIDLFRELFELQLEWMFIYTLYAIVYF